MFYVYYRHIPSGSEHFVNVYDTAADAIAKITSLYNMDAKSCQKGEYYYFMKQRGVR